MAAMAFSSKDPRINPQSSTWKSTTRSSELGFSDCSGSAGVEALGCVGNVGRPESVLSSFLELIFFLLAVPEGEEAFRDLQCRTTASLLPMVNINTKTSESTSPFCLPWRHYALFHVYPAVGAWHLMYAVTTNLLGPARLACILSTVSPKIQCHFEEGSRCRYRFGRGNAVAVFASHIKAGRSVRYILVFLKCPFSPNMKTCSAIRLDGGTSMFKLSQHDLRPIRPDVAFDTLCWV